MSVYLVNDKKTIAELYKGWDETLIWSCLQDYMGIAYADSLENPQSAQISLGDFCFFAGKANDDLILNKPSNLQTNFAILTPQNKEWEKAIERCHGEKAERQTRYAIKKELGVFDASKLHEIVKKLPFGYELKFIDFPLYNEIMSTDWARDFCGNFADFDEFNSKGLGVVAVKNGEIVSGASSYTSFIGGIEIEIITREDERRKGLAAACGAKLILECLNRNWYPSWDAHNTKSLALAEKLGYTFDKEYPVYEVEYCLE